jgi:glucose-1-phosphate thymidylyltransferase
MRGIILAGGTGSRLAPLTDGINKHMLPVGRNPMIFYPINTMYQSGIKDVLIVTGNDDAGQFVDMLGDGSKFGMNIMYSYQEKPLGIADALKRGEVFANGSNFLTILGDNIFTEKLKCHSRFVPSFNNSFGRLFLTDVAHPEHYGVAEFDKGGALCNIEEKPKMPKSTKIVTGAYVYPNMVFDMINDLSPSKRGELEITDLNNMLIEKGIMEYQDLHQPWFDCGESVKEYNETCYKMKDIGLIWE